MHGLRDGICEGQAFIVFELSFPCHPQNSYQVNQGNQYSISKQIARFPNRKRSAANRFARQRSLWQHRERCWES